MDYKHKPDRGALFLNQNKTNENQPDYTGSYTTPDGQTRRIAAWINETKNRTYLSITFSDEYKETAA